VGGRIVTVRAAAIVRRNDEATTEMANIPQKSKDPTEEALFAIEEALTSSVFPPGQATADSSVPSPAADLEIGQTAAPPVTADLLHKEPPQAAWADDAAPHRAANDDRAQIGQILQTLRRRPTRAPYVIATIAAFAWAAGALATGYLYSAELQAVLATPRMGIAAVIGIAGAVAVPIIFFYVLAQMFSRAQDMRVLTESMAEVAMRMAQPETVAHDSIVTVGQAIRREVAAMGDGVERALARAAELEALVHNEVSALERAFNDNEVRIRDLLNELSNQRETLVNQAEQVRNAISSVHLDLSHDITSVGDLVSEKVSEVAQRVTRTLTEKGEHITLALGHAGDSMIDTLSERGSTLLERLETTSDRATTAISSASERLTDSLKFKTENVHDEFAELAARLQQMMTTRLDQVAQGFAQNASTTIEQMASRSEAFTAALTDASTRMTETITARGEQVNATLRAAGDALVQDLSERGGDVVSKIEQTGTRVADTIISRSNTATDTFRDNAEVLVQTINNRGDAVKDMLTARLQAFEDMFNHGGTELTEKISRDATTLGSLITRHVAEFDHTVKTYGGELVERLGQRTQDVSEAMRAYLDTFDERVSGRTTELSGTLDRRLAQFEELLGSRVSDIAKTLGDGGKEVIGVLDNRISEVSSTINARGTEVADAIGAKAGEIDRTLGERAVEVANTLDSRIARFEELLVGRAETVTNQLETSTKAAADALNARMEELSQSIKVNSAEAERSLGQLAISTTDAIRASASQAERTLLGVSEEVAHGFVGKANEITSMVSQRTHELETLLSDKSGSVLEAISEKGQQFAGEITQATSQAIASIEEKGFAFTRSMIENGTEISRRINVAGENAASSVSRTLNELHDTAQKAIVQSKHTATSTVSEMLQTHNMLRSDTTALFERLREGNILLQEVLSGSHESMSALENTLMLRVSEFVTAMNEVTASTGEATTRVEANIGNFRDVTGQVLTDLGQLAHQFDTHGQELAKAVELIDRSNQRTEDTVNERRVQLDSLVTTLDTRTEDLEQRLKRFSGLLDESLEAASARARDVARVVAESSTEGTRTITEQAERVREQAEEIARVVSETGAEGTRAITEQYERVREHAEVERRRAADAMHDIYEQSAGDTHALFREANERFAETVRNMKQMATEMQRELETTRAEMQRELDATRAELRRGVLELPQETAESAAQMRRVIVDQIEALAELNRIVARHGRNLDAVEPLRRSREEPSLTIVGGRGDLPPRSELSSRNELPPRTPLRTDVGDFAPAARRAAEAPAALTPTPPSNAGRGWLTDLLNRASREESEPVRESAREPLRESPRASEERTPRHSIESLDSLSVDIARMIDHDAAADLWDRYKRGERNVFTRRLYTLQGQQAFDEFRKKYRADREFKQTVDRYISEFERLLEEVSHDDRGQVVARTYLTSETGKVYTMLAHAAGRFD
jgi:hypothetical protein